MEQIKPETAQEATVTQTEIRAMALVLKRRYENAAAAVAGHFAAEHEVIGDFSRASVWTQVAEYLNAEQPAPTLS